MEKRAARSWYLWLWLSPLVTVPLCASLVGIMYYSSSVPLDRLFRIAVPVSAVPHLILLKPALTAKSAFVRWHGRQALLLAGVRTAVPFAFAPALGDSSWLSLVLAVLVLVWLIGTLLGQEQAARGDCSLARWVGRADVLPPPDSDAAALIDIIRYSQNPKERSRALSKLEKMGRVEPL